jgi:hypothetical protein
MLQEFIDGNQLETFLLAFLPMKLQGYLTGNFSVDMIIITVLVGIVTNFIRDGKWFAFQSSKALECRIDFYANQHGDLIVNPYYNAMVWLISDLIKNKKQGHFSLDLNQNVLSENDLLSLFSTIEKANDSRTVSWIQASPHINDFNFIPYNNKVVSFQYLDLDWTVMLEPKPLEKKWQNQKAPPLPSLVIRQCSSKMSLQDIRDLIIKVNCMYRSKVETTDKINRLDYHKGYWDTTKKMMPNCGLQSVCLSKENEELIQRDLDRFQNNELLYSKLGIPFKRGMLFSGPPGTGKSSLIVSLASELHRDIYYLNLGEFKNNRDLRSAFSNVPRNSIVVMEDIDASSSVVLDRSTNVRKKPIKGTTLSTILDVLDGALLAQGIIVIMTSNHPEVLDPALIRPGRIDLHLHLGYATKYQLTKMYQNVMKYTNDNGIYKGQDIILDGMEDGIIPPCEAMRIFLLYRDLSTEAVSNILKQRYHELLDEQIAETSEPPPELQPIESTKSSDVFTLWEEENALSYLGL